jgi:serine/threonine-protein kinase
MVMRPDDRPPSLPRVIGGVHLLRPIGDGAMSAVYLGFDPKRLRPVAVKVLADHLATSRDFVARFLREARFSERLAHPNLIRGLGHGHDREANRHYLTLEYIDGPNALAVVSREGRLPVPVAVRIGIDIAQALRFLHARNLIHRDVKPDNILLGPDGTAKLGDLGLTRKRTADGHSPPAQQGVGTPHYMPHEQSVDGDMVDGRSDLFALGATLYHLLTGVVPFTGNSPEQLVAEKARGVFPPAREVCPDIPAELDDILARTLARRPADRFQTAGDLVTALLATRLAPAGPPDDWPTHAPSFPTSAADPAPVSDAARTHPTAPDR